MSIIDKIKIGFSALFGGVAGLIKALLDWFNAKVLAKLDKETAALVCKDALAVAYCLTTIADNHGKQMSDSMRLALTNTILAVKALAVVLENCEIAPEELDEIIDRIKDAIDAWKKAK